MIRKAYIPGRTPLAAGLARQADGLGPSADVEKNVLTVVDAWNARIPRNRVRVLTQSRYDSVRCLLGVFSAADVVAAIEHYSRQDWQRRRNAWRTFDAFLEVDVLTQWVESAAEAAERRQDVKDKRLTQLAGTVASGMSVDEQSARTGRRRWAALPVAERRRLWQQASAALGTTQQDAVMRRVLEILKEGDSHAQPTA